MYTCTDTYSLTVFFGCELSDSDPLGVFFSICVGLTHFSPRPHPTVPFPKHMCSGRGISKSSPRGTCWHRLQIWYWTLLLSASHIVGHHQFPLWWFASPAPNKIYLCYKLDSQTNEICQDLFLLMLHVCVYKTICICYHYRHHHQMPSWLHI